jgi:hypothetical protein
MDKLDFKKYLLIVLWFISFVIIGKILVYLIYSTLLALIIFVTLMLGAHYYLKNKSKK